MKNYSAFGGKLAPHILDTLTPGQCLDLSLALQDHKEVWDRRSYFWTLGSSAYLDTAEDYRASTPANNERLLNYFSEPIGQVIQTIGTAFQKSAGPMENPEGHGDAAVPGFHIIDHTANGKSGMFHVDLPYQRVYWPGPFSDPFSFTTLIQAPAVGAGLWHWDDMDPQEGLKIIEATRNESRTVSDTPEEGRSLLTYEVGKTYVHSGRVPHAIADMGEIEPGEYRITLQGHGAYLLEEDYLVLYF
tara:strand:+ start:417 stop:1151 length:735 start_codon:yes stop_codon:yes gene_type:complete